MIGDKLKKFSKVPISTNKIKEESYNVRTCQHNVLSGDAYALTVSNLKGEKKTLAWMRYKGKGIPHSIKTDAKRNKGAVPIQIIEATERNKAGRREWDGITGLLK